MRHLLLAVFLLFPVAPALAQGGDEVVVYWDSEAGKSIRTRMPADADYWHLAPNFATQETQSYCAVATAVTVLNAMPIEKPVDPTYAPYAYFTQRNFFNPSVTRIISPQTVLAMGMTREEMRQTLALHGVETESIAGDKLDEQRLRALLRETLRDDGQFVLANYFRGTLGQVGGGHWSVLAAYDEKSDRVLILDVARYKYPPAWVQLRALREAIATLDTTSNQSRGLVVVHP